MRLINVLGISEAGQDRRFLDNASRVANRIALASILEPGVEQFTRKELLAKLEDVGVPAGPINELDDVFSDPQVMARNLQIDMPYAGAKNDTSPGIRTPIKFSRSTLSLDQGVPRLSQHTKEIIDNLKS